MAYWDNCSADCEEGFFIVQNRKGIQTLKCKVCDPNKPPAPAPLPGFSTTDRTFLIHSLLELDGFLKKIALDVFANQYAEELQSLSNKIQAAKQRLQDA